MRALWAALVLALLVGCGGKDGRDDETAEPSPNKPRADRQAPWVVDTRVPVETFLVGTGKIPPRLKASSLELRFRSNVAGARFECRTESRGSFRPCDPLGEAKFVFETLLHGRGYLVEVRARSPEGAVDVTPLRIEFLVDNVRGAPLTVDEDTAAEPVGPEELPIARDGVASPDDPNPFLSRALQIGSAWAVVVPTDLTVTSYSTNKTMNGRIRLIRLLGDHAGSAYPRAGCSHDFEMEVEAPNGARYCDSTPSEQELARAYRRHMPYNHVEMVRGRESVTDEKVLVATFEDQDRDPVESHLGINDTCSGSRSRGRSPVPLLAGFFDLEPQVEIFSWCQVRDRHGVYWWLGTFTGSLSKAPGAPRVRVIYTLSTEPGAAGAGILTGRQFAEKAGTYLSKILVPLTPQ